MIFQLIRHNLHCILQHLLQTHLHIQPLSISLLNYLHLRHLDPPRLNSLRNPDNIVIDRIKFIFQTGKSLLQFLLLLLSRQTPLIHFPERQPQQNPIEQNLRKCLNTLLQQHLILVFYTFANLMGAEDDMIDPILHNKDPSAQSHEDSPKESVMFESMLIFEVTQHWFTKSTDEKGKYLLEGDHLIFIIIKYRQQGGINYSSGLCNFVNSL